MRSIRREARKTNLHDKAELLRNLRIAQAAEPPVWAGCHLFLVFKFNVGSLVKSKSRIFP